MEGVLRAVEVAGAIDDQHQLHLDAPLPFAGPGRVRVIILFPAQDDIDETQWLHAATTNSAFDFLNAPEEDIYQAADGKPFYDQG